MRFVCRMRYIIIINVERHSRIRSGKSPDIPLNNWFKEDFAWRRQNIFHNCNSIFVSQWYWVSVCENISQFVCVIVCEMHFLCIVIFCVLIFSFSGKWEMLWKLYRSAALFEKKIDSKLLRIIQHFYDFFFI